MTMGRQNDPIAAQVEPLHRVASALSLAASAARQGRPVDLDLDALADLVDDGLGVLLAGRRRAEVYKGLAVRASRAEALLYGALSGQTTDVAALGAELLSLRASLGLIRELERAGERERQDAA